MIRLGVTETSGARSDRSASPRDRSGWSALGAEASDAGRVAGRPNVASRAAGSSSGTVAARPAATAVVAGPARRGATSTVAGDPVCRPCSATPSRSVPSRCTPTAFRRRLPDRRPVVSTRSTPAAARIHASSDSTGFSTRRVAASRCAGAAWRSPRGRCVSAWLATAHRPDARDAAEWRRRAARRVDRRPDRPRPTSCADRGHEVVDWVADYLEGVEQHPVRRPVAPGEVRARLPAAPARAARAVRRRSWPTSTGSSCPGITHWQHPAFFAYFPANTSGPSHPGRPRCRPASACRACCGRPARPAPSSRPTSSTGSSSCSACPTAFRVDGRRRRRHPGPASSAHAVRPAGRPRAGRARPATALEAGCVAYASTQAHSSLEKAARIAGLGADQVRLVDVDDALRHAARRCWRRRSRPTGRPGCVPCFVMATVGTTSSLAVDPVRRDRRRVPSAHGVWLHVDGGHGRHRPRCAPSSAACTTALERADSLLLQPAQVAVHEVRLRLLLRGRPRAAASRPCRSCPSTCATRPPTRAR